MSILNLIYHLELISLFFQPKVDPASQWIYLGFLYSSIFCIQHLFILDTCFRNSIHQVSSFSVLFCSDLIILIYIIIFLVSLRKSSFPAGQEVKGKTFSLFTAWLKILPQLTLEVVHKWRHTVLITFNNPFPPPSSSRFLVLSLK